MTQDHLLTFVRKHRWAVAASISPAGEPHASIIGIVVTPSFEIVFDTIETNRKVADLRRNDHIALAIGEWDDSQTIQIEGRADELAGKDLERAKNTYGEAYPEYCRARQAVPGLVYFCVRPTWMRYSDFRVNPAVIVTVDVGKGTTSESSRQYLKE